MENTNNVVEFVTENEELVEAAGTAVEVAKESIDWGGLVKTGIVYSLAGVGLVTLGKLAAPHVMKLFNKSEESVEEDIYEDEVTDIEE